MKLAVRLGLVLVLSVLAVRAQSADPPLTIEVFQVLELPVAINNAVLSKTKGSYLLKCSLTNSSEFRQLGLRYSLAVIDAADGSTRGVITRSEGFALAPYQTNSVTFKTPIKLKLKGNERLVLMLEQITSADYVWDVINSRDAFRAYTAGDYSLTPRVLRVSNQVDARPLLKIVY